jgi:hypothetical protein
LELAAFRAIRIPPSNIRRHLPFRRGAKRFHFQRLRSNPSRRGFFPGNSRASRLLPLTLEGKMP